MEQVLVTGGSGFIGRNLVDELARRACRVRCLVRRTSSSEHLRDADAELCFGDVTQPDSLIQATRGVDTVFHVAGLVAALRTGQLEHVNGQGTWNVARACAAQARPPVLVVVSSLAAAGPTAAGALRRESDPLIPVSAYGRSKRAGEAAAAEWAGRVPTTIVRPGIVFGPWDRLMLPVFRSIAKLGIHPVPTFAPPPLSLIHVQDLADILIRAAESGRRVNRPEQGDSATGYYSACSAQYPNYAELGRMTAAALGRQHLFLFHMAEPLPWLVAGVTQLITRLVRQPSVVTVDKMRESIQPSWAASTRAIRKELGFTEPYTLQQRLDQTAAWYREHGWI